MNIKLILLLFLVSFNVIADEVKLKDGSLIKGKILKVHKGKLHLSSELIGSIAVSLENVESYKTDDLVSIKTQEGKVAKKKYDSLIEQNIQSLWAGEKDPDVFINKWSRLIYINMVKRHGNKDEENFDGGIELSYLREFDTLKLYAEFDQDSRNDNKTSDEYRWGVDYEKRFGEVLRHSWYLRAEWEKDRIKGIDLRSTYATGYGYYFIKEDKTLLRGRAGLLYRIEDYIEDDSSESVGVDFGLNFKKTLFSDVSWYTDITYSPAFDDFGNFTVDHESGLEIPFKTSIDLSLKTGVNHEYDSHPAEDTSKLDTKYFMKLQLKF